MEHASSFKRSLGLFDSTMLVVGSMIGSGIFIVSADIARTVGSAGWLLVVWVITGAVTLAAALSYGELASMMPQAGGQYVYLREAYGPLVGFLYGWTLFLVIQTGTIAAVAVAFAKYTSVLLPWFSESHKLVRLGPLQVSAAQLLAIAVIALLTAVNWRGIREGKVIQNVFTTAKVLALLGLIVLGVFVARDPDVVTLNLAGFWQASRSVVDRGAVHFELLSAGALLAALGVAQVGSLFSADAWNNITFTAGEVAEPHRNVPLSLALGTGIVIALYLLANVAYLSVLPITGDPKGIDVFARGVQYATFDRVATAAASRIMGDPAAWAMAVLIMVSTFGCANGLILAGARVYYAMAKDGVFFRGVGELNANAVPGAALVLQSFWAALLCLSGSYGDLLDYVIFAVLIFYVLTVGGLFILRKRRPDAERPYKAWGYPLVPFLYMVVATAIALDLLVLKPRYTWPGIGIVLLGVPVYFVWKIRAAATQNPG